MVAARKIEYNINCQSSRRAKVDLSMSIVQAWRRDQTPPGRFLKMNEATGRWNDVGDREARKKTSQALRENAPDIRRRGRYAAAVSGGYPAHEGRRRIGTGRSSPALRTRFERGTNRKTRLRMLVLVVFIIDLMEVPMVGRRQL
jgi:hypothetical protein